MIFFVVLYIHQIYYLKKLFNANVSNKMIVTNFWDILSFSTEIENVLKNPNLHINRRNIRY